MARSTSKGAKDGTRSSHRDQVHGTHPMDDVGPRTTVLPPHIAKLFGATAGGPTMVVVETLRGPVSSIVVEEHAIRLLAAGLLLAEWERRGSKSIRLERGRIWPEQIGAGHVDGWQINEPAAQRLLVASIAMGERYRGWKRALEIAGAAWMEAA